MYLFLDFYLTDIFSIIIHLHEIRKFYNYYKKKCLKTIFQQYFFCYKNFEPQTFLSDYYLIFQKFNYMQEKCRYGRHQVSLSKFLNHEFI